MGHFQSFSVLRRSQSGTSLVEAMVVVMIVAILATVAIPYLGDLMARQRLRGAADNLRGDLVFARSEAIKRQSHVFVIFSAGSPWCYAVTLDSTCGCNQACASPDLKLKQVRSTEAAEGVQLLSAAFAGSFCGSEKCIRFEAFHGNANGSNGTATFQGAEGSKYKVIVASVGRPRACRASGDTGGFLPAC